MPGAPTPPKRGGKGLLIGLISLVIVIAVACVLVFVVFKDDIFSSGAGSTPEKTVSAAIKILETGKFENLVDLMDFDSLFEDAAGMGIDADVMSKDMMKEMIKAFVPDIPKIKFSGIKMATTYIDDSHAVVRIVEGKMTVKEGGFEATEDVRDADEPLEFFLVEKKGKWYLDIEEFDMFGQGMGLDLAGSGDDGDPFGSTETTEWPDEEPATTTTAAVRPDDSASAFGNKSPEDTVRAFLKASEDQNPLALIKLFDPDYFGGLLTDEMIDSGLLEAFMEEDMFDFGSIKFHDIKMKTTHTGEGTAKVEIIAGTVTITDPDGTSETDSVEDSGEPLEFFLVERDGSWYIDPFMFD